MNELSIHGQYNSAADFFRSVEVIMEIRQEIRRHGRELFCHQNMVHAQVTPEGTMQQVIQGMPLEKRQAWIHWLSRGGPYWMEDREHGEDEWLETGNGRLVTDTAAGEAAYCRLHGLDRELVSVNPSDWTDESIHVRWVKNHGVLDSVELRNHCALSTVSKTLDDLPQPFDSWRTLESHARRACDRLTFSEDAFEAFNGQPYAHGAAERILIRLRVLNTIHGCFDNLGDRTAEGDRLYAEHFTGKKAWFSDSSDSEKREFKPDLTFPHPEKPGENLFCTWHGKVKTPQLRIHFSWPIAAGSPLYIVYVGPKITKR
jgi:hypothetical protein